jgi:hypothetical protein
MKLPKFLLILFSVTFFSFLYVHQQAEIIRLAYVVQKQSGVFQDLLDKNTNLRYNIEKSASLIKIGEKISASKNFQMPDTYRLVVMARSASPAQKNQAVARESLLSRVFSVKRQAVAETIEH